MRRLAVLLAMAVLLAGVLAYLREPSWLASVESGFGEWEIAEDGTPFRWTSGHASFFVRADAAAVTIPLRSQVANPRWPAVISVAVDDRLAEQLSVPDREWREVRIRLPPPGSRELRRIDLQVDRTEGGIRGLQVGRIEVSPAASR